MTEAAPAIDLYLIRHAESAGNLQPHIISGRSNEVPLSEVGVDQAKLLGDTLSQVGIEPELIFTSPAVRARQTADHALSVLDYGLQPVVDDDLQEVSQGDWEGLPRNSVYKPHVKLKLIRDPRNFRAPGGESLNDANERMKNFLGKLVTYAEEQAESQTVLAFSHGLATRTLFGNLLGWSIHEIRRDDRTPNTSISLLRLSEGFWQPQYIGKMANDIVPPTSRN